MSLRSFVAAICGGLACLFSLSASAGTVPAIQGHVFQDVRGQAVSNTPIFLYMDDGDQEFDADDSMAASTVTDESGRYEFDGLDPNADYFVTRAHQISDIQSPGMITKAIDTFDSFQSVVSDPLVGPQMDSISGPEEFVLGGHRDLYLEVTGGIADAQLRSNPYFINSNVLQIDFAAGVTGVAAVTWDGIGGSQGLEPDAGLGGMDFTAGGLYEGIVLRLATDRAGEGQELQLLLHSDANVSTAAIEFPVVPDVRPTTLAYVPFTDFVGTADATDVTAFQLIVNADRPSVDARISMIALSGPAVVNFDVLPEPTAGIILLSGLWGLLAIRGRRGGCRG